MSDVKIRCRENGPLVVEGSFALADHEGNLFPLNADKPSIALCRCGASANKPFCDGAHRGAEFNAPETAPPAE
ncbi:MAG: CDGSH iron-sulfur domain-containing protein [Planctomycetota bacterium]|nr:CDGSH iron-sulfur domain-containing protein [Planctomycetota bacterium]